jgi:hypothetical protein
MLANWVLKTRMRDKTSGIGCFNRKAMERVLEQVVSYKANSFQTEIRHP